MKLQHSILIGATLLVCCQSAFLGSMWQDLGREFTNMGKSMAKDLINVGLKAVNQTMNIGCRTACPRLCEDKVGMYFCPFVCVPLCNRGKRSIRKVIRACNCMHACTHTHAQTSTHARKYKYEHT